MNVSFVYVDGLYSECLTFVLIDIGQIAINVAVVARRIDSELIVVIHHGIIALRIRVRD